MYWHSTIDLAMNHIHRYTHIHSYTHTFGVQMHHLDQLWILKCSGPLHLNTLFATLKYTYMVHAQTQTRRETEGKKGLHTLESIHLYQGPNTVCPGGTLRFWCQTLTYSLSLGPLRSSGGPAVIWLILSENMHTISHLQITPPLAGVGDVNPQIYVQWWMNVSHHITANQRHSLHKVSPALMRVYYSPQRAVSLMKSRHHWIK